MGELSAKIQKTMVKVTRKLKINKMEKRKKKAF